MPSTHQTLTDPALAAVAAADEWAREAKVAKLVTVLDWTSAHQVSEALVETPGLQLGGPGCPVISEYDTWDLSCVLQLSAESCTTYVGNALELRHRLARLWQAVLDLDVTVWRAFRIAARTQCLPMAGAAQVDQALAHCAQSVTLGQVERTVATALADFCPLEAQARRERADESRCFDIDLRDSTMMLGGTVGVTGVLDLADAMDLDAAVAQTAAQLADLGSTDTLNVRRAAAVGEIARAQLALDLDLETSELSAAGRAVTIYAHVDASDVAHVEGTQTPVLVDQLLQWCQAPGTKVTIKPVIDLHTNLATDGYVPDTALSAGRPPRPHVRLPLLHPTPHRPRPHRALRLRRTDRVNQSGPALPRTPPLQDLQPLVLHLTSARPLHLAQPRRRDPHRRPSARTLTPKGGRRHHHVEGRQVCPHPQSVTSPRLLGWPGERDRPA